MDGYVDGNLKNYQITDEEVQREVCLMIDAVVEYLELPASSKLLVFCENEIYFYAITAGDFKAASTRRQKYLYSLKYGMILQTKAKMKIMEIMAVFNYEDRRRNGLRRTK